MEFPWLDRDAFPFPIHELPLEPGVLRYAGAGEGEPVLLVHGNPSWAFMYRAQMRDLAAAGYRVIAPDHLGFGLSDKPPDWTYRPDQHAANLGALVDHLGLEDVHLVVHDWGGPIGLGWALEHPEKVKSLTILNTWMWRLDGEAEARRFSGTLSSLPAQFLIRRADAFVRVLMPLAFYDKSKFRAVASQYRGPFTGAADREGVAMFPRSLMLASEWLGGLWERRAEIADKPTLFVWALKDPVFRKKALERWKELFPDARYVLVPKIGHYVAEEMGESLSPLLLDHLGAL